MVFWLLSSPSQEEGSPYGSLRLFKAEWNKETTKSPPGASGGQPDSRNLLTQFPSSSSRKASWRAHPVETHLWFLLSPLCLFLAPAWQVFIPSLCEAHLKYPSSKNMNSPWFSILGINAPLHLSRPLSFISYHSHLLLGDKANTVLSLTLPTDHKLTRAEFLLNSSLYLPE